MAPMATRKRRKVVKSCARPIPITGIEPRISSHGVREPRADAVAEPADAEAAQHR